MGINRPRRRNTVLLSGVGILVAGLCFGRAMPSTQKIRGEVLEEKSAPIPEALCTLTSRLLSGEGLTTQTDYKGKFEFLGLQPGEYTLLCAASGYEPLKRVLEITDTPPRKSKWFCRGR